MTYNPADWDALEAELDNDIRRWSPDAGDKITGLVVSIRYTAGRYGTFGTLRLQNREGQQLDVAARHQRLRNQLVDARVQAGDLVAIKYLGQADSSSGRKYHDYVVQADTRTPRRSGDMFDPSSATPDDDDLGLLPDIEQ